MGQNQDCSLGPHSHALGALVGRFLATKNGKLYYYVQLTEEALEEYKDQLSNDDVFNMHKERIKFDPADDPDSENEDNKGDEQDDEDNEETEQPNSLYDGILHA